MKKYTKHMKNEKGMTLIELLAVIVIIAIIAAIAVPAIGGIINNSRDKAVLADASNILAGAKIANVDGACTVEATGNVKCSQEQLKGHVENVKATAGVYSASYDAAGKIWTVVYPLISGIKNDKYKVTGDITEAKLNAAMEGNSTPVTGG
ncbi:prepilin-type N-terminal cleavage/methylation domain-containing protein [Sporosarcina sp. resist]|uniref:prepilin-type N-terminal cleavage/methylation domain-containing protein n=1 Tax=Sporosarcina sp. resist TaxID=2762563 RepID=UPI00164E9049|nr:prepilin-type N-terminal cleavage/methylation domain-containing protein [Sporosarcina sp. resist]QNK89955.1 prepilin-type N-terminal cleavage/methylation domain-containing protein [Sporosarcina sp. resist]